MTRSLTLMPLGELAPHPENPKAHNLTLMRSSVETFGYIEPIVRDERTGFVISGHGRLELLQDRHQAKAPAPEGIEIGEDGTWLVPVYRGWASKSDSDARAALVALNKVGEVGGWDELALITALEAISADDLIGLTGFTDTDLAKLVAHRDARSDGSLLARSDVTLGEPDHKVSAGDCFGLAGRHVLVVVDVMSGWALWAPRLTGEALFVPYPGPYAAISQRAERQSLVLVQPDTYIAGHLLDKFAAIAGEDQIESLHAT